MAFRQALTHGQISEEGGGKRGMQCLLPPYPLGDKLAIRYEPGRVLHFHDEAEEGGGVGYQT